MWNERLKEIVKRLPPTIEEVAVWDDYNECFPKDQDVIGTITTQIGNPSPRHGFRIIEVYGGQETDKTPPNEGQRD
jgi:hypothetical protein